MKHYVEAEIEILRFTETDVIATSEDWGEGEAERIGGEKGDF